MIKPDLYHKSHHAIKQHVGKLIREFSNKFQWGNEDKDVFCDVGTGPGDFFVDHIYPLVKSKCKKIILADISKDMIDYCQKNFHISEKFEYKIFDIAAKSGVPAEVEGKIDHVTSMLVMHWVSDIRKALKNTFDLLSPNGGDCVIVFFAFNTIFNACNELSTSPKWYPYTRGEDNFMLTFENSKDCKAEFSEMMKAAGFENIRVDMESTVYDYETEEGLKENMISVCHALDFIPESRHSEFMDELGNILAQLAAERLNTDPQRTGSILSADVIVAYGQKMSVNKI